MTSEAMITRLAAAAPGLFWVNPDAASVMTAWAFKPQNAQATHSNLATAFDGDMLTQDRTQQGGRETEVWQPKLACWWAVQRAAGHPWLAGAINGGGARWLVAPIDGNPPRRSALDRDQYALADAGLVKDAIEALRAAHDGEDWLRPCRAPHHPKSCRREGETCPQPKEPEAIVIPLTEGALRLADGFQMGEAAEQSERLAKQGLPVASEWWERATEHATRIAANLALFEAWSNREPQRYVNELQARGVGEDMFARAMRIAAWHGAAMERETDYAAATEDSRTAQTICDLAAREVAKAILSDGKHEGYAYADGSFALSRMLDREKGLLKHARGDSERLWRRILPLAEDAGLLRDAGYRGRLAVNPRFVEAVDGGGE